AGDVAERAGGGVHGHLSDRGGARGGDAELHVAGAGTGRGGGPAVGRVLVRGDALRDARRAPAVRGEGLRGRGERHPARRADDGVEATRGRPAGGPGRAAVRPGLSAGGGRCGARSALPTPEATCHGARDAPLTPRTGCHGVRDAAFGGREAPPTAR